MSTLRKENTEPPDALSENGQRFYDERLRDLLEPDHNGQFVAIESGTEQSLLSPAGRIGRRMPGEWLR